MSAPAQPMSARRQLRLAVVGLLNAQVAGVNVISPGDWPTPPEKLPALLVNTPTEQKQSVNKGMPEFTTTVSIVVQGQLAAATAEAAQDAIEQLAYQVENTVLMGYWINELVQQFSSVQTDIEITADGRRQLGGFKMTFNAEVFEAFDPTAVIPTASTWPLPEPVLSPFAEVQLHLDMASPFDPNGTYANPPFPAAVTPAPRTTGPDGRDEAALDIQLPQ